MLWIVEVFTEDSNSCGFTGPFKSEDACNDWIDSQYGMNDCYYAVISHIYSPLEAAYR